MTVQTFRDLLKKQPFAPFRVVMSSGETYDIRHPEMAWIAGTDLLVGVGESKKYRHPLEYRICSLLHVTSVEPLEEASKNQKKNGRKNGA